MTVTVTRDPRLLKGSLSCWGAEEMKLAAQQGPKARRQVPGPGTRARRQGQVTRCQGVRWGAGRLEARASAHGPRHTAGGEGEDLCWGVVALLRGKRSPYVWSLCLVLTVEYVCLSGPYVSGP